MDDREQKLRDEEVFWRNLIEGREWQGKEPVYPRMRDALADAEQKLKAYLLEPGRRNIAGEIPIELDKTIFVAEDRRRNRR